MKHRLVLALTLALAAVTSTATAQPMITLEGIVRDSGGGIARASVSVFDSLTGERRSAITDGRGFFRVLDLSPGRYSITARSIGHAAATQRIQLAAGNRASMELFLLPAAVTLPTVEIRHSREATTVERMSVATIVGGDEIRQLPLATRNVMELAGITPGIRYYRELEGGSLPAAGPLRDDRALNVYVDGLELKNLNSGSIVGSRRSDAPFPAEALQELTVLLNSYDAEYTRGSAFIISAVTHRGTNERRGSLFGSFQNRDLVAVTSFQRRIPNFEEPAFSRAQAGFTLRGPLIRDRLFYSASFELSDRRDNIAVVPGRPESDPGIWDSYAGVFAVPSRNYTGLLRLTWSPDDRNLVDLTWSSRHMDGEFGFGGIEAREYALARRGWVNTFKARHRWLPSAQFANEANLEVVSWTHSERALAPQPAFIYETLRIGRGGTGMDLDELQLRAANRVTLGIGSGPGSHLLKGGVELGRASERQFFPINNLGVFRFRSEIADPFEAEIGIGFTDPTSTDDARTTVTGWVVGGYLNDEWQPTSRLRINVGLRYDAELSTLNNRFTVPWASDTALASLPELRGLLNRGNRRNDLNNFSPRVSFSWDAAGNRRLFVRGGFGIMHDRVPGFLVFNERRTATWRQYVFATPGTTDPEELRNRILTGGATAVPPSMVLLPEVMEPPENRQWSIGFGAQLTQSLALDADYVDHDVRNIFAAINLNWRDLSLTPPQRVLTPDYGNIVAWGDFARARYRALLTRLSWRRHPEMWLCLSHTLGSAKADWDLENFFVPAGIASEFYVLQRTSGDERHRFVLSGRRAFPGGFAISTIATVASPRPYRTKAGTDENRNSFLEDDWIDGRRYAVPPNTLRHWYRVVDLRVTRAFHLGSGRRLSVIGEAFNVFNTENYSGYFGVQRSSLGELMPDFGTPSGVFSPRQIQLGSRIDF